MFEAYFSYTESYTHETAYFMKISVIKQARLAKKLFSRDLATETKAYFEFRE